MAQKKAIPCPPKGTHRGDLTNIFECDKVLTIGLELCFKQPNRFGVEL